jgi:altronate hydrolase
MQKKIIKVNPTDNVAVALVALTAGEQIEFEGNNISVVSNVNAKHKIALVDFNAGDRIIMYGVLVGKASQFIKKGDLLSTLNVKHESDKVTGKTETIGWNPPNIDKWKDRTFLGYHREDGQVGTENVWLFFPLVFCENRNIEILKDIFEKELMKPKENDYQLLLRSLVSAENGSGESNSTANDSNLFNNIQVKFITHQGGCGGIRQDSHSLAKLLAGYVNNPNVAGATVLSLGCQNLQIKIFKDALHEINPNSNKPVLIYDQQQIGTIEAMMSSVVKDSFEAIKEANKQQRKPAPLSKLSIGLECGGSDGFSGISANPTLGQMSDILAALGGTTILSEFPELCGV